MFFIDLVSSLQESHANQPTTTTNLPTPPSWSTFASPTTLQQCIIQRQPGSSKRRTLHDDVRHQPFRAKNKHPFFAGTNLITETTSGAKGCLYACHDGFTSFGKISADATGSLGSKVLDVSRTKFVFWCLQISHTQSARLNSERPVFARSTSRKEAIKNYIKKETATFFGVDEESEEGQLQKWRDRRKRLASR